MQFYLYRLLWVAPYLVLIPAITFFLLINYKNIFFTFLKSIAIILIVFHIINFLNITPYHYTYLNSLSGEKKERYKKFENDYWSVTLKELILSSNLPEKKINYHTCGVSPGLTKSYMKQRYGNVEYTDIKNATYIIMTNRTVSSRKSDKITNCFDEYASSSDKICFFSNPLLSSDLTLSFIKSAVSLSRLESLFKISNLSDRNTL